MQQQYSGLSWLSVLVVVGVLSLVLGGFMFLPSTNRQPGTSSYLVLPEENCTGDDNLHLCTFIIITLTPTPKPLSPTSTYPPGNGNGGGGSDSPPPGDGGAPPL